MSAAQVRMADALLRTAGGRTVLLRMPAPALSGDVNEELGLATPLFQDIPLGPAVFRRLRPHTSAEGTETEMLLSASSVNNMVGATADASQAEAAGGAAMDDAAATQVRSAERLFRDAMGVLVDGQLYELLGVSAAEAFGSVFLWRLKLRGEVNAVV